MTKKRITLGAAVAAFAVLLIAAFMPSTPAGADAAMSPLELAQVTRANCQVLLAHATSTAQRNRAKQCIADQSVIIAALSPSPSPTASPTASPSPSPTATGPQTNCVASPARCGFPDAASTGPSGPLTVSTRTDYATAGETIVNTQINGCATVRAAGVTFRNVLFNAPASCGWGVRSLSSGLTIVDSEITCSGSNGTGIGSDGFSLLRVDIHNCENGLDVGSNASLVDSWLHDMTLTGGAHADGVQIGEASHDLVFRHNTIAVAAPGATSAIISWDEGGTQQQRVVIDANLLSGGTFTLYCPRQGTSDTKVTNNRFGPFEFGYANACTGTHVSAWSGNVRDSDGAALAAA